jgi:hypothetical protein
MYKKIEMKEALQAAALRVLMNRNNNSNNKKENNLVCCIHLKYLVK